MRTLTETLLAAQRSASARPYVRVWLAERIGGVARLIFARLYAGVEEDGHAACAVGDGGALLRVRLTSTPALYHQRVVNPGPSSDFATWTLLSGVSPNPAAGLALAAHPGVGEVWMAYNPSGGDEVHVRASADGGGTYPLDWLAATALAPVVALALAARSTGDPLCLFFATAAAVYVVKRSGGSWGTPSAWTNAVGEVTGLAATYQGDWNLVVTGRDGAGGYRAWTCIYGDDYGQAAGTWSPLRELAGASAGSGVEIYCPALAFTDTHRLSFVERYTGTGGWSRPYLSHSTPSADFADNRFREPYPFDLSCSYGPALAAGADQAWLCTANGVWRAPLVVDPLDVSDDVLGLTAIQAPAGGQAILRLRNDHGRYAGGVNPATGSALLGAQVEVAPGYYTAAGAEVSAGGPHYWIERVEHALAASTGEVIVHAVDGGGLLAAWRASRQFGWAAGTTSLWGLLSFVLGRAGLEVSSQGTLSTLMTGLHPAYAIAPGTSAAAVLGALLELAPEVLWWRGTTAYLKNPVADEAAVYTYGEDCGHPILQGRYGEALARANHVRVVGPAGQVGESLDWEQVGLALGRPSITHNPYLTLAADLQAQSSAALRKVGLASPRGGIVVPTNCGQELWDVVEVSEPRAGLVAVRRRVMSLTLLYDTAKGLYQQRLALGEA